MWPLAIIKSMRFVHKFQFRWNFLFSLFSVFFSPLWCCNCLHIVHALIMSDDACWPIVENNNTITFVFNWICMSSSERACKTRTNNGFWYFVGGQKRWWSAVKCAPMIMMTMVMVMMMMMDNENDEIGPERMCWNCMSTPDSRTRHKWKWLMVLFAPTGKSNFQFHTNEKSFPWTFLLSAHFFRQLRTYVCLFDLQANCSPFQWTQFDNHWRIVSRW